MCPKLCIMLRTVYCTVGLYAQDIPYFGHSRKLLCDMIYAHKRYRIIGATMAACVQAGSKATY